MAEIGLVASIFSIAAVGTKVATNLYEAADVMIHANQQIFALAKHVSQSAAVLKHMGQVLKTEKANCSKELLRDIRKIKHSCKRTFKEINSTIDPKRSRHFAPFKWLFKRTKTMELETRLDSQQSMLQCIIHTLTVSKLGHMDSRSKQDSEHINGLKDEIRLLKTFIMESHNNVLELRRAEQSTEAEKLSQPISGHRESFGTNLPDATSNMSPSNRIGESSYYESPVLRSPSPRSSVSDSDKEDSSSDAGTIDDDSNRKRPQDQINQAIRDGSNSNERVPRRKCDPFPLRLTYKDPPDPDTNRESTLLLQMVPYRPKFPFPIRPDRLISGGQGPESGSKSATQEATDSVRLLLDKWTTSGSAPISNILDEEVARERIEAELAEKRRSSAQQSDPYRRSQSPGAEPNRNDFGSAQYRGRYPPPPLQDDPIPPPPPWDSSQPQYGYPPFGIGGARQKDFWRPSNPLLQQPDSQLGSDMLNALRTRKGGIYYTKSNQYKQVHYVDEYPIYICALVPSHMIPFNDWKPLNTELGRGLVRREALDLLGYSYAEKETGVFSISSDVELRDIEELVKLSYQALARNLKERSKSIIRERNWGEGFDAMNRGMEGMYSNEPLFAPTMPESWNQTEPPYGDYTSYRPATETEIVHPDKAATSRAPPPRHRPRESPFVPRRARSISVSPPRDVEHQEQAVIEVRRPEVRFALPRAQVASATAEKGKGDQESPANPDGPRSSTDDELQKARRKHEQLRKKKEDAEKAKDFQTASDMTYYAIPDLERHIERLLKQQDEEQRRGEEKGPAPLTPHEDDKKAHQTEVQSEDDEYSDDSAGSGALDLYD